VRRSIRANVALRDAQRGLGARSICRIEEDGNTNSLGHQLMQESQPLAHHLLEEKMGLRGLVWVILGAESTTKLGIV
jgi:hypothetical protein